MLSDLCERRMQIRSRDLLRPQNWKKSLRKNGTSLKHRSFSFSATREVFRITTKGLCPELVKYFIYFENKRFFVLVPSPQRKLILIQDRYFKFCQKVRAQK